MTVYITLRGFYLKLYKQTGTAGPEMQKLKQKPLGMNFFGY